MSNDPTRINELMKKLDALLNQQEAFGEQVKQLKEEINSLKSSEDSKIEKKPEIIVENLQEKVVVEVEDFEAVKLDVKTFDNGVSINGEHYIKFQIKRHNISYTVICLDDGSWKIEKPNKEFIAKGKYWNKGRSVEVTKGSRKGEIIYGERFSSCIADAAGLNVVPIESEEDKLSIGNLEVDSVSKTSIEKYIGENLITVIGIIIVLIGVVFGVKYSIEHNLISNSTRIMLSYGLGVAFLAVGIKLKKKYENFSAVLVGGAMAITYFTTYAAYTFYHLMPQLAAFASMVVITIFTVLFAIHYNRQVMASIGLVCSYAIPFLLSKGDGSVTALFTYIAIINAGILVIALKRYWKKLFYLAFSSTWIIFISWGLVDYNQYEHFEIGLLFTGLFFVMFYITFLAYKLIHNEKFGQLSILMVIINSSLFYGLSFVMLEQNSTGKNYLGLFTLLTAGLHAVVSVILHTRKLSDKNMFYLSTGLALVFITIAIPVELDGAWITLLWGAESVVLFWIGRTKAVKFYEFFSYSMILIALCSYGVNVSDGLIHRTGVTPCVNQTFMMSLYISAIFGGWIYINSLKQHKEQWEERYPAWLKQLGVMLPMILIVIAYNAFRLEFDLYWMNKLDEARVAFYDQKETHLLELIHLNKEFGLMKMVWFINYTMLFFGALYALNYLKLKNIILKRVNMILGVLGVFLFLTTSLLMLSFLREMYVDDDTYKYPVIFFSLSLRYISYVFVAGLVLTIFKSIKEEKNLQLSKTFDIFLHTTILWILGSELINLLDLSGSDEQYKLVLSILCGLYSIFLVAMGIYKKQSHLRIAAIALFAAILVKLFLYDIAHQSTIAKTIVFISLGIILLIISFMYNKYKHLIED